MSKKQLKVAVVGLRVGRAHAADYAASDAVGELLLCDCNTALLAEAVDQYPGARGYADFTEMLRQERPDAVSIALPNKLHRSFSIQALEAGCHVLCEKPMARNATEALAMARTAERCERKLMINFNQRFESPVYSLLKEWLDAGRFGKLYYVKSRWSRRRGVPWWYPLSREMCGGGALVDLGVHVLDRAMWWCGFPEPEWVLGNTYCGIAAREAERRKLAPFELEDFGAAAIRMRNGMLLMLEASWASNRENEEISVRLYAERGGALIQTEVGTNSEIRVKLFLEQDGVLCDMIPAVETLPPVPTIRQAFLEAILQDTPVPCSPEQGILISRLLDAIYQCAATGAPVRLTEATPL